MKLFVIVTSAVLAVAGCQEPQRGTPGVALHEQTITIDDLALRLGLRIQERDQAFVVMKDATDTVLIFTHTGGRFFINGKPVGPVGTVEKVGNTVYVPETLVSTIRSRLRLTTLERPAVTVPTPSRRTTALVVVDAGHGGKDPGTTVGGIHEKHIVLAVARKVAALLRQQGVTVVMTREDDRYPELEDRADIANRRDTDLFVSIHADSAPNRSISGYTIYTAPNASRQAYRTAQSISAAMGKTGMDTRGIREAEYKVLVLTRCPAVLVELGYLSNAGDARRLQDPVFQGRLAQAIADGILNSLQ